jgi:hypothetical protein
MRELQNGLMAWLIASLLVTIAGTIIVFMPSPAMIRIGAVMTCATLYASALAFIVIGSLQLYRGWR